MVNCQTSSPGVRCEDLCAAVFCFENRARAIYKRDLPKSAIPETGTYCTDCQIKIGEGGVIMLLNNKANGWQEIKPEGSGTNQFLELIDLMACKVQENRSSGLKVRHTMEIMMVIHESLRIKDFVQCPLKTRENSLELMVEDGTLPVLEPGSYDIRAPFPEEPPKKK